MLIRSNQLTLNESTSILDSGVYLTEAEAALNPVAVPVLENQRLGVCTVSYNDIQRVCEDYGCYNEDALYAIAEASNVDIDHIAVAIDESDIILDPSIVNEFPQYVVKPLSENSLAYIFCESAITCFLENDLDYSFLDLLVEAGNETIDIGKNYKASDEFASKGAKEHAASLNYINKLRNKIMTLAKEKGTDSEEYKAAKEEYRKFKQVNQGAKLVKNTILSQNNATKRQQDFANKQAQLAASAEKYQNQLNQNRGKVGSSASGTSTNMFGGNTDKVEQAFKDAQKSNDPGFISKKVAALRNFYKKFLDQANKEHDQDKISWYKNIARVILTYIDKLLAKLDKTKSE